MLPRFDRAVCGCFQEAAKTCGGYALGCACGWPAAEMSGWIATLWAVGLVEQKQQGHNDAEDGHAHEHKSHHAPVSKGYQAARVMVSAHFPECHHLVCLMRFSTAP